MSVSIIAILAALLIPAIMHSRAATRRTVCQSNLRQWALAVRMYADSHHGKLPYRGQGIKATTNLINEDDWFNALPTFAEDASYIELKQAGKQPKPGDGTIWMCPDAVPIEKVGKPPYDAPYDPKTFFAYGMNMALSTPYMRRPDHIDRIGALRTMVFMADGIGAFCSVIPHPSDVDGDLIYNPIPRHVAGTVNIAFMDGHVEAFAGDEVGCGIGDPQRPDIVWWPPNSTWPGPPK